MKERSELGDTYKTWANAMKNTPIEHGQVMSVSRCAK